MRTALLVMLFLVNLSATSEAIAEPGPIGQWLMNEPVTLWDRGMDRAKKAAERAAETIGSEDHGAPPFGGAWYEWDNNEIIILFRITEFSGTITHYNCNLMRRAFIAALIWDGHARSSEDYSEEVIHWMVGYWFSHSGYTSKRRDEKLPEKLTRIVFVNTILRNERSGITCKGRITASDVPSRPLTDPGLKSRR